MEQQALPPEIKDEAGRKPKRAIFPSLIWEAKGSTFSISFVCDCNLGQNKIEMKPVFPPISWLMREQVGLLTHECV